MILDSTVVRAHPHAAGTPTKRSAAGTSPIRPGAEPRRVLDQDPRRLQWARSPVQAPLDPGQAANITTGEDLLEGLPPAFLIADKGSDSKASVDSIAAQGAEAVIPSRASRTEQRVYDRERYKDRNLAERFGHRSYVVSGQKFKIFCWFVISP